MGDELTPVVSAFVSEEWKLPPAYTIENAEIIIMVDTTRAIAVDLFFNTTV